MFYLNVLNWAQEFVRMLFAINNIYLNENMICLIEGKNKSI